MTNFFGLNVVRKLAEIADPEEALKNIGLDVADLEKIRGISTRPVSKTDLKTLSNLDFDAEKVTYSLRTETDLYEYLTNNVYDKYSYIDTNLDINGGLAAATFKYNYVDFPTATVKSADISTSRVSSWSTFTVDTPDPNTSPIFYGGEVNVEGPIELSSLLLTDSFEPKKYNSQIPTHKVKVSVNGETLYMYAMKGIPLSFIVSNIRNVSVSIESYDNSINASWRIATLPPQNALVTERKDLNSFVYSTRNPPADNRVLELYYPPARIKTLNITGVGLRTFTSVVLSNTETINISNNDLLEIPNFSGFTNLKTLDISRNNFTRASNASLRTFSSSVVSRLPSGLTSLNVGHTFGGNITGDISLLPLVTANFSVNSAAERRFTGVAPVVNAASIVEYNIGVNRFTSIPTSLFTAPNLRFVYLSTNVLSQNEIEFSSANLEILDVSFNTGNPGINLINVSGKQKLTTYNGRDTRYRVDANNNVQSIFDNCPELTTVNFTSSNVYGNFPTFSGCSKLRTIGFRYTNIKRFSEEFFLHPDSFSSCKGVLDLLHIESPDLKTGYTTNVPIHPETFYGMFNLRNLLIVNSLGANNKDRSGLEGQLTDDMFKDCSSLTNIVVRNTNITSIPLFSNSPNLNGVDVTGNMLVGNIPDLGNRPNLRGLVFDLNAYTGLPPSINTRTLTLFSAASNQLAGSIPDYSNLVNITNFNLRNNLLTGYTRGSFATMTNLVGLDLFNNNFSRDAVDDILRDMEANYNAKNRTGVQIILSGPNASAPSSSREIRNIIDKLRTANWSIIVS